MIKELRRWMMDKALGQEAGLAEAEVPRSSNYPIRPAKNNMKSDERVRPHGHLRIAGIWLTATLWFLTFL